MIVNACRTLLLGALLAGCVGSEPPQKAGPKDSQTVSGEVGADPVAADPSGLLSAPEGKARIVVFRGTTFGVAPNLATPQVKIDGASVGNCKHNAVVVRDLAAGTYDVSIQTDVKASKSVTLAAGEVLFLRCNVLPIGLLLPAPALDVVQTADVPERVFKQARQP